MTFDSHELRPLTVRAPLGDYLRALWARRQFMFLMPLYELRARNMNNVLGHIWFVLNPLLLVGVYYLFFGLIVGTNRGIDNFVTFLAAGVFSYSYIQRTVTGASRSLVNNISLLRAFRFPTVLIPISDGISQAMAHVPVILVLFFVALITGERPHFSWLLIPFLTLLQGLFALGLGLAVARLTDIMRDVQSFLPFVFRLMFYMSGVLYSVEVFVSDETILQLFHLNPFYDHIELLRAALFGQTPNGLAVVGVFVSVVVAIPLGFVLFRRGEPYGSK
jgi:teichoic acid transport system permease protein